ncbi:M10 family metallopeptidase [Falsiroseomonas sp. E2-1-a20]|uniref:M10 family metallopeptidase n=1 Tax=Falsiroseomonas sp. E2-1-a20 TaxID=3239300 RepID=UPI003F326A0A
MCWLCRSQGGATDDGAFVATTLRADLPLSTAPRFQFTSSGHAGVDGVLSGYAWSMDDPLSFAFPDSGGDYESWYGTSEPTRGFGQVAAPMREAVRQVLVGEASGGSGVAGAPGSPGPHVTGFTNLFITESADDWAADMRFAKSSAPSTAWAYYPNGREGGDVWFGNRATFDAPKLGNYAFLVAVHEIGHALGLKHPHESWNGFGPMPREWDMLEFTVMSYRSHAALSTTGGYVNGTFDYPQGWMMLDIAALQHLYGADYTMQAGNTVYAWDPATGETLIDGIRQGAPGDGTGGAGNRVFLTVWDGGGVDTYDLSAYAGGVAVDLAPGAWSVTSWTQLALLDSRSGLEVKARGNVFNALLHQDDTASLIENAVGGAGADTLLGNEAMNHLFGGAGRDLLEGRAGDDVLDGGGGADTMRGGSGHDRYLVDDPGDLVIELNGEGMDTVVSSLATTTLPDAVEALVLAAGGVTGLGNNLANMLTGNAAANRLEGRGGADVLEGRGGNDTLSGGAGADTFLLRPGDGFDLVEDFTSGVDKLALLGFGRSAAQVLGLAEEVVGGLRLDLGHGDGVLLAGLARQHLLVTDLIA